MAHLPPLNIHDVDDVEIGQPRARKSNAGPFSTCAITFRGPNGDKEESVVVTLYGEPEGLHRALLAACKRFVAYNEGE